MLSSAASSLATRRGLCRTCLASQAIPPLSAPGPCRRFFNTTITRFRAPPGAGARDQPFALSREPRVPNRTPFLSPYKSALTPESFIPEPPPSSTRTVQLLLSRVPEWAQSKRVLDKFAAYGLERSQMALLAKAWSGQVQEQFKDVDTDKEASIALATGGWDETSLRQSISEEDGFAQALEAIMTRKLVQHASIDPSVSPTIRTHLKAILDVTDLTRLPFEGKYTNTRAMRREFHLHIGPTNSGKTYTALKALAKAPTGAYAGPLRLLAHEVWERLNLGTVGGLDGQGRQCNLLTGEERRIVDAEAGLTSCTVEMLPLNGPPGGYDIVVIDEIQMLGDSSRGGSWTTAVLGVRAKQVHLCGDETTLQLLTNLLPAIGDNLTVHRYDRLSPLSVAETSLEGDFNKIEAGDCVVTFSRNNIYSVKKLIESQAGKKCAVVYGALPPETRADQARDFNDENGRCEVMVASDAVGMGLNLKIKRIVFESLEKYNGRVKVPLALTQIKQIAGRAGRFGMRNTQNDQDEAISDDKDPVRPDDVAEPGGIVTTLNKGDLPILREVLPMPLLPIQRAVVDVPFSTISDLAVLLSQSTTFGELLDHLFNLCVFPPNTKPSQIRQKIHLSDVLQPWRDQLNLKEIETFTFAPVSVRDPIALLVFTNVVQAYAERGNVDIEEVYTGTRLLSMLDLVEATLAALPPIPPIWGIGRRVLTPPLIVTSIPNLETMHKTLVMYIWLSFRYEVAFPHRSRAMRLKERTETVLEECLQRFPGLRNKKTYERTKQGDRAVADWRKANVAPNGTRKMPGTSHKGILWVKEAVVQRLRNKQVWASAGVLPKEKWLHEVDGRGPGTRERAENELKMVEASKDAPHGFGIKGE